MRLELHVWGPAFGLPSIDAECLAAIAYLNVALGSTEPPGWFLVASHDTSLSPTKDFPALHDGSRWVGGFDAIVEYLRTHHDADLDRGLDLSQHADRVAFITLHRTRAIPLLDVAYYTSFANYYHSTRPAFTALLPWHANYIVPPSRRAASRARTQRMGLDSLDTDTTHETSGIGTSSISSSYEAAKRSAGIGAAMPNDSQAKVDGGGGTRGAVQLGRGKRTLTGVLRQPEHFARFKLNALCDAYLAPLDELMDDDNGGGTYLLNTEHPTSLDCVALGYLSLMIYPELKQPWLADTVRAKYPRLERYTNRLKNTFLGRAVTAGDVLELSSTRRTEGGRELDWDLGRTKHLDLPWIGRSPEPATDVALAIGREILDAMPGMSSIYKWGSPPMDEGDQKRENVELGFSSMIPNAVALTAGLVVLLASVGYYHLRPAVTSNDHVYNSAGRARHIDRGEAGALLAALGNRMQLDAAELGIQRDVGHDRGNGTSVEVDVTPPKDKLKNVDM